MPWRRFFNSRGRYSEENPGYSRTRLYGGVPVLGPSYQPGTAELDALVRTQHQLELTQSFVREFVEKPRRVTVYCINCDIEAQYLLSYRESEAWLRVPRVQRRPGGCHRSSAREETVPHHQRSRTQDNLDNEYEEINGV